MMLHSFKKMVFAFGVLCVPLAMHADDQTLPNGQPNGAKAAASEPKKTLTKEELFSQGNIDRLSITYGHMIQKSLSNPILKLNADKVMQGIQEGVDGKPAPMSDQEYESALTQIQKVAYDDMANKNLQEAESYLKKNASEPGVKVLDNGKLQYKIEKEGSGNEVVTEETMPTITYNASFSNGQKLGSSEQSGGPIEVRLDETIPGFRMGILGMKVGEKRRIFIHPDLGYGKAGQLPNGLLIFEIEVMKLQPKPAKADDEDDDDLGDLDDNDDLMVDSDDDDNDDNEVEEVEIEEITIPAKR